MNKKLFALYKGSDKGKKVIKAFNPEIDLDQTIGWIKGIGDFESGKTGTSIPYDIAFGYFTLCYFNFIDLPESNPTREEYENFIKQFTLLDLVNNDNGEVQLDTKHKPIIQKDDYRRKATDIPLLSLYLYYRYSFFKPMLFQTRFDIFQRNCYLLGIDLPAPPREKGYLDDCMYYYDICEALDAFQDEQGMTDAELCACVYDCADMLYEDKEEIDMPEPTNVWLTGGSKGDFKFLDSLGEDKDGNNTNVWACNERTRKGDIIVMYCLSPRSYIHSIWRANSEGIFNPFDGWQSRTALANGMMIPPITLKDLKADDYFKTVPIVRKDLQGVNGWELTANDYSELLRMVKNKGGDISQLPKLFDGGDIDFGEIKLEKDVEENILIPALRKLGYNDTDWTRQLELKAGRQEKAIPDFVFYAHGDSHFELAPLVIEAKLDMSSTSEQDKAFRQCFSYARLLQSKLMGICDKERIVVYKVNGNTVDRSKPLFENHWKAVFADANIGAKLKQIIGSEVVKEL